MEYNSLAAIAAVVLVGGLLIWYVSKNVGNKKVVTAVLPDRDFIVKVLSEDVPFFQNLNSASREVFADRVKYFLQTTKITPEKGAELRDVDRVLIATSATIPLFHFQHWSYENLDEVIVYPNSFDEKYGVESRDNMILGMVGEGVMNRKMILSLDALRSGFSATAGSNTAIHEFVHLIDKADGDIDGVPEYLIPQELIRPWLKAMHANIEQIRNDESSIRPYAGTNEAEFFAVVSEYFFQKPTTLKEDHPELYALLDRIYNPHQ